MSRALCVVFILLVSVWGRTLEAATYDNSCSGGTNAGTSASCTMTIGTLTNGILLIYVADHNTTDTITTPTVGGSSTGVTLITTQFQDAGTNSPSKLYYLLNPPSGSQAIAFTATSNTLAIAAITYSGVDQVTPNRTVGKTKGASTSPSVSATTVSGDTVAEFFAWDAGGGTLTYDASQTSRQMRTTNTQRIGISEEVASGTSTTASGTLDGVSIPWAVIAVPLIDATGGSLLQSRSALGAVLFGVK